MCKYSYFLVTIVTVFVLISPITYILLSSGGTLLHYSDIEKCPYCFGKTLCDAFVNISYKQSFFTSLVNTFNTKNVFYVHFNAVDVVIKKLGSNAELSNLDDKICRDHNVTRKCDLSKLPDSVNYKSKIWDLLNDRQTLLKPFKLCSEETAVTMLERIFSFKTSDLAENEFLQNVWTILEINVEPLMIQLLESGDNWPVPKYYGSCGRFIVEEDCGIPLTYKTSLNWMDRVWLTIQLLQAARNFTSNHPDFRFYLTDLSADNIAVDSNLKLTFIDLENVVVIQKNKSDEFTLHQSEILQESGFAFSEEDLCSSSISDHNYYAVCTVLLSKNAEWPMMKNGLLREPPESIVREYGLLFDLIEECAVPTKGVDRLTTSDKILNILTDILVNQKLLKKTSHANQTKVMLDKIDL